MVALGILAGLLLVVTALLITLLKGTQKASDETAGTILAEQVMLERLSLIFADLDPALTKQQFFDSDSPPQPPLEGTVRLNQAIYTYRINYRTISDPGGFPVGGDATTENRIKKVDTVVWWWNENPDDARAGYGQLRTEITRLINEKTDFDI
jgi:hypothetical protein